MVKVIIVSWTEIDIEQDPNYFKKILTSSVQAISFASKSDAENRKNLDRAKQSLRYRDTENH